MGLFALEGALILLWLLNAGGGRVELRVGFCDTLRPEKLAVSPAEEEIFAYGFAPGWPNVGVPSDCDGMKGEDERGRGCCWCDGYCRGTVALIDGPCKDTRSFHVGPCGIGGGCDTET